MPIGDSNSFKQTIEYTETLQKKQQPIDDMIIGSQRIFSRNINYYDVDVCPMYMYNVRLSDLYLMGLRGHNNMERCKCEFILYGGGQGH